MAPLDRPGEDDLLIALRHPPRERILRPATDGKKRSPREHTAVLRTPLSKTGHDVRALAKSRP